MSINTDLNISPYFDDFDEEKQYNKILFKPSVAVQARELTQLQTILQNQVERFGENIYKEGTVISGVNITERSDLFFIKLNDQSNFPDPTAYEPTDTETYYVLGQSTGLRAEIVKAAKGFQTRDPDLKTFFIKYLNTDSSGATDVKEFARGEILNVQDSNGTNVTVTSGNTTTTLEVVAADISGHSGKAFGVSVEEGIIFQRGHFIYVKPQVTIASKYSNIVSDVSVGFNVEENIVTSDTDDSLLDNANGFNNANAPGSDRLQLTPVLTSYATGGEPEGFFTLARYVSGEAVLVRDVTQFQSIAEELAKRTYDESGNYKVNGMSVSLEQEVSGNTTNTYAVVAPGKAYVNGYEVQNLVNQYLSIDAAEDRATKRNQASGIYYGQYYNFIWETYDSTPNMVLDDFQFDGTRYTMYDASSNVVGTCSIANVEPGPHTGGLGRIYVYAIDKESAYLTTAVARIENTPVIGSIKENSLATMVFPVGQADPYSMENGGGNTTVVLTQRMRETITPGNTAVSIADTATRTTIANSKVYGVDGTNNLVSANNVVKSATLDITFDSNDVEYVYYDALVEDVTSDSLAQTDVYVQSTVTGGKANLGIPNAVALLEVIDDSGSGDDVTSKFRLVQNARHGFYHYSYIELKTGETLSNPSVRVKFTALRRTSSHGSGYLNVDSYANVDRSIVPNYTNASGQPLSLSTCFDFRPYMTPLVAYVTDAGTAPTVATSIDNVTYAFPSGIAFSNEATVSYDFEYYLPRVDVVAVNSGGDFEIIKGTPSERPRASFAGNMFPLAEIYVPGKELSLTGNNPLSRRNISARAYTMKDIEAMEKRIENLTETLSLSLLENETKDLFIPDSTGNNRFKNGIVVDNFDDVSLMEIKDAGFKATIDTGNKVVTPLVDQFPVDLKYSAGSNLNVGFDKTLSLGDNTTVTLIDQPFATTTRNAVSNFYSYRGSIGITPEFDTGYDLIENPSIELDIDIASAFEDLLDGIQNIIPLTTVESNNNTTRWRDGSREFTRVTTSRTTRDLRIDGTTTTNTNTGEGEGFVTNLEFKPYVRAREMRILVSGLRPNARHYFYFDETSVDAHVQPGSISAASTFSPTNVFKSGVAGGVVRTDTNGVLAAVFNIPEGQFFVGENILEISDVDVYADIESSGTSYAKESYRAYSFGVEKRGIQTSVRTPNIRATSSTTTTHNTTSRREERGRRDNGNDPIAQTFFVKRAQAQGEDSVLVKNVHLWFKTKSTTNGITVELREVNNGYPSQTVVPFAKKYLKASEVYTSDDASTITIVQFDDLVRLSVDKEYAIVVIPDANDPNFTLYVSRVGGTDISTGRAVAQDWGDGVLFTSTNNRAWKSYQNEDLKFKVQYYTFNTATGYAEFVPNDPEFFAVANTSADFIGDEYAYSVRSSGLTTSVSGTTATMPSDALGLAVGDFATFVNGANTALVEVTNVEVSGSGRTITFHPKTPIDEGSVTAYRVTAGRVEYYNKFRKNKLHLKESSARTSSIFASGDTVFGVSSGANTVISTIENQPVSYMQPMIFSDVGSKSRTTASLYNGATLDRTIYPNDNSYMLNGSRTIPSKSNILNSGLSIDEDFIIRVTMDNNGVTTSSPILDRELSMLNVYTYNMENDDTSSTLITKSIKLQDEMDAVGLKVFLSAYRPVGTFVDVYARFVYENNIEEVSDWTIMTNSSPRLYSSSGNVTDYREFEYDLPNEGAEFSQFQIKVVMRHATSAELLADNLNVVPDEGVFPHLYDYRAIALT